MEKQWQEFQFGKGWNNVLESRVRDICEKQGLNFDVINEEYEEGWVFRAKPFSYQWIKPHSDEAK